MTDDQDFIEDDPNVTADEAINNAKALMAELQQLRTDYDALSPEEKADVPATVRRFFGDT